MYRPAAVLAGAAVLAAGAFLGAPATAAPAATAPAPATAEPAPGLYVDPFSSTYSAASGLTGQAKADAQLLGSFPTATWLTSGSPEAVAAQAADVVSRAEAEGALPTLVAYNVPFRDCAQYSSGGATTPAEYEAWIDGVAEGIGDGEALVILEPDGLGIIPHYTTIEGTQEWCQPAEVDPATAAQERFDMLNYAVDAFSALPGVKVYLDAGHSGWLNVGDNASRLVRAGVERADGFFLNASNYQFTANLTAYGTWVSQCVAYVTEVSPGDYGSCGNQYWNGGPATNWSGVAMNNNAEWSAGNPDPALNTSGVDSRYESILGGVEPTAHFVIDTSRNGVGPWEAPAGVYSDPEVWCNPPARGLGALPTLDTGNELVDAHLWIKVPGESDGQCFRGTGGPLDPERGMQDPRAGGWFVEQARELIELAAPPVEAQECAVEYTVHGSWRTGFTTQVRLTNTGDEPVSDWTLRFDLPAGSEITRSWSASWDQEGTIVTAGHPRWVRTLDPGERTSMGFNASGAAFVPGYATLNGEPCTVNVG
ncbi:glycoside hydrolase family 6 protein [Antribacter gilvus]|uniref:glycoside hydrolase family 6 protein n=1 Tax=Antribacter gilvus TaxID=2304675 RepID=UPI001F0BC3F1|nr:glycoside hydrolase family 6 protein [Antribacter gilvus]